jgi:hypothetical protein
MLRRIDDSDENIRVLACSVLLYFNDWLAVVHSLGLAGASTPTTSDSGGRSHVEGVGVGVVALTVLASKLLPSYQQYLEQCCLRLVVGDPSKMFKSRMAALLQGAGVIDVDVFGQSMAAFLAAHEDLESDVRRTWDQLLQHAEVARFGASKSTVCCSF